MKTVLAQFRNIPGVGPSIAQDLVGKLITIMNK